MEAEKMEPLPDSRPFVRGQMSRSTEFPRFVFRGASGESLVQNKDEADKLLADGWYLTRPEAIEAQRKAPAPAKSAAVANPGQADGDTPPTRAELVAKAEELGIEVDGRWTEDRMREAIDRELKKRKR